MLKKISKLKEIYFYLNIQMFANRKKLIEEKNTFFPYSDVTTNWIEKAKPNSHKVLDRHYFEYKNVRYVVDNKNVVLDYSNEEKRIARWLENTFGGELYMLPRINSPKGIKTADYLFRNEYWDLKT